MNSTSYIATEFAVDDIFPSYEIALYSSFFVAPVVVKNTLSNLGTALV